MSKYYVIKPKSSPVQPAVVDGVKKRDKDAEFVDSLKDCDIVVLQYGWTRSKTAVIEYNKARAMGKKMKEACVFVDLYVAKPT